MSDYEFCRVEREGPLTVITLNRPEVMNALHPPAHFELNKVFDDFAADPAQWVAIVTGAGDRAFSAGNDLKYQASGGKMSSPPGGFAGLTSRFDLNKPLIAAVNGIAMGGGFEIALACDLIVASEAAIFALPEPRVGLAALAGGLHRLPRVIGPKRALGMILTGRRVSAREGLELGFVNDCSGAGRSHERRARLGEANPRAVADVDPRLEGGRLQRPRRTVARRRHRQSGPLSGRRRHVQERRLRRRARAPSPRNGRRTGKARSAQPKIL